MKSKTLRILIPLAIGLIVAGSFVLNVGIGDLSAFGWRDISVICPLGALTTMLAAKSIVPRAVISLVVIAALAIVLGRFFCGWICPVPVINKLPRLFKKKNELEAQGSESRAAGCSGVCEGVREKFDSRHLVLLGSIASAAVFGFPVFCLICPIGLSFATIFLVISLFAGGDLTWSILIVPALLLLEVTVFRRWCAKICPLGAFMSLMGKIDGRLLKPTVDRDKCIETDHAACGRCHAVCEVHIDPRHPEEGAGLNECLKCRECVDACPGKAISLPFRPRK